MSAREIRLFHLAGQLDRLLLSFLRERLAGAGLTVTPAQAAALFVLRQAGPSRLNRLAEELGLDGSAVTRLADRLEKAGLAQRRRDPEDRRAWLLALTPGGERAATVAAKVTARANREALALLGERDAAALKRVFCKLGQGLAAAGPGPGEDEDV